MGHFTSRCNITGLPISPGEDIVVLPIIETGSCRNYASYCRPTEQWKPFLLPMRGQYDTYGWIEGHMGPEKVYNEKFLKEEFGYSEGIDQFSSNAPCITSTGPFGLKKNIVLSRNLKYGSEEYNEFNKLKKKIISYSMFSRTGWDYAVSLNKKRVGNNFMPSIDVLRAAIKNIKESSENPNQEFSSLFRLATEESYHGITELLKGKDATWKDSILCGFFSIEYTSPLQWQFKRMIVDDIQNTELDPEIFSAIDESWAVLGSMDILGKPLLPLVTIGHQDAYEGFDEMIEFNSFVLELIKAKKKKADESF
jgi:hypothetical protein